MVVGQARGESPSPLGKLPYVYVITKKGECQVKNNDNFWFITLIALFVIAENTGWNIFMRIAVGCCAVAVLISVAERVRGFIHGGEA